MDDSTNRERISGADRFRGLTGGWTAVPAEDTAAPGSGTSVACGLADFALDPSSLAVILPPRHCKAIAAGRFDDIPTGLMERIAYQVSVFNVPLTLDQVAAVSLIQHRLLQEARERSSQISREIDSLVSSQRVSNIRLYNMIGNGAIVVGHTVVATGVDAPQFFEVRG